MKKFISILLVLLMCISIGSSFACAQSLNEDVYREINLLGDNENVIHGPVRTYAEMVEYYIEKYDITRKEAEKIMPVKQDITKKNVQTVMFRELKVTLDASTSTQTYKPKIVFHCQVSGPTGGSYWGIDNVYYLELYKEYNGISKQFSGDLTFWLRSRSKIEYIINGDFFNNGNSSGTLGVTVNIGGVATVSFSITDSSNHFRYFYEHETKQFV